MIIFFYFSSNFFVQNKINFIPFLLKFILFLYHLFGINFREHVITQTEIHQTDKSENTLFSFKSIMRKLSTHT